MSHIFFNGIGVEPVAYVGGGIEALEIESCLHGIATKELVLITKVDLESSVHALYNKPIKATIKALIYNAIHEHYTYHKINAPVDFNCSTYLQTEFEDRYVDTESKCS